MTCSSPTFLVQIAGRAAMVAMFATAAHGQGAPPPPKYFNPAWSPDGQSLAFESDRAGRHSAVYLIRLDGTGLTQLTSGEFGEYQPRWSPDGKRIAFGSRREGSGQIYTMATDGTDRMRITTGAGNYFLPSYSPDGRWILFGGQSTVDRSMYNVGVVGIDGVDMHMLSDTTLDSESPRWSLDGRRVHFVQPTVVRRDSGETPRSWMQRRNASLREVAVRMDGTPLGPAADSVTWVSADRRRVYFLSRRAGTPATYAMDADGTNVRRIGDERIARNVSRDGHWAAYDKQEAGAPGIFVFDIMSGTERLLVGGPAASESYESERSEHSLESGITQKRRDREPDALTGAVRVARTIQEDGRSSVGRSPRKADPLRTPATLLNLRAIANQRFSIP